MENNTRVDEIETPVKSENDKEDRKIIAGEFDTLVLSGGSLRGFLVLGSLQYAMDNNLLNNIENYV